MPSSALLDGKKRRIMQALHTQRPVLYPAGQYIQMEQEPLDRVLVVVEGLAKVRSFQHNGCEEVLNLLGPGDCMGLTCLFDACSAWGDVVALTDVQVLRVACADLAAMMEQEPEMALCCMAMLHDQLLGVKRRVMERRLTTNERLLLVLQEVAWKAAPMDGKDGAHVVPLLSHEDLVRLGLEVRDRLQVLEAELQIFGRQCETASHGVSADICRAMADLKTFLGFFEERVMHHRMRLRRAGKANPVGRRTASVHEVA